MAFDHLYVEGGGCALKLSANFGGEDPGTPVLLFFDIVQMGS